MMRKGLLLVIGGMSALALAALAVRAASLDLQPMIVNGLTGTLRVQQSVPCADDVDLTTPVIGGQLELTPADGIDVLGGKVFTLNRADVAFAGFSVHRECLTIGETRTYTDINVQLAHSVTFTALSTGPGTFAFTIPKADFAFFEAAKVNSGSETGYKTPKVDPTGTIDFAGRVHMFVVVGTKVHFQGGCTIFGCIVNEDREGTLTANLDGTMVLPDTDHDGVPDRTDNCRFVPNPDQTPVATPVMVAPVPITLNSCLDHHIGTGYGADVCDQGPVTVTNNAPGTFLIGVNPVTWRAEDSLHRVATATQDVTIVDTTPPIFATVPPDLSLNNCGSPPLGTPTATDDCAGTVTFSNNAPGIFLVGVTPVTWTAHDVSGNTSTAIQTVTVVDTVPPTVSCMPDTPTGGSFRVSAADACGAPTIRLGTFVLAEGEQIKINVTGQPGVQFINQVDNIRHFQVGRGEAIITATDGSGHVTSAICQ